MEKKATAPPFLILQKEHKALRAVSAEVPVEEIKSAWVQEIITRMKKALAGEEDGVALAAPQIGENVRIFIIGKRILNVQKEEGSDSEEKVVPEMDEQIFINPRLVKASQQKMWLEEGCLSIRPLYGKVKRSVKATVEAFDEKGKKFTRGGSSIIAQIYQHELDHLDGILFTDKAKDIEEIPTPTIKVLEETNSKHA